MKLFLTILVATIFFSAILLGFLNGARPKAIDSTELSSYVEAHNIRKLRFVSETEELIGETNQGAVTYHGALDKNVYVEILKQKVSASAFLGPVLGFGESSPLDRLGSVELGSSPFFVGEKLNYDIEAMGFHAGRMQIKVEKNVHFQNLPALIVSMHIETNRGFTLYTVNDQLFTAIRADTLTPLFTRHDLVQKAIYGVEQIEYSADAQSGEFAEESVSSRNGLINIRSHIAFNHIVHNVGSIFYKLRTLDLHPKQKAQIYFHDKEKVFLLDIVSQGTESISTGKGTRDANHLQISITQEGRSREPIVVDAFVSLDRIPIVLAIKAKTKIGVFSLGLVEETP